MQRACLQWSREPVNFPKIRLRAAGHSQQQLSHCEGEINAECKDCNSYESRSGDDLKVEMCGWCTAVYESAQALAVVVETALRESDGPTHVTHASHHPRRGPIHPPSLQTHRAHVHISGQLLLHALKRIALHVHFCATYAASRHP